MSRYTLGVKEVKNLQNTIFDTMQRVLERDSIGATDFQIPKLTYFYAASGADPNRLDHSKRTFVHDDYKYTAIAGPQRDLKLGEVIVLNIFRSEGKQVGDLFFRAKFPIANIGKLRKTFLVLAQKLKHRYVHEIMTM